MKKELKRRWLKALRSRKYHKVKGCLRYGERGFCCLGVLCDIAQISHSPGAAMISAYGLISVGLQLKEAEYLAKLNDGHLDATESKPKYYRTGKGMSFRAIAQWISRNIPGE